MAEGKEEVIYAVLNAQGQVEGLYAVNIFEGGDIVDYDGLQNYTDGVNDLLDGAQEMKDGTGEFRSETADINDTITDKIDAMIAEKTGSDVQLTSFTDPRNTEVDNVQFVITTPAIRVSSVSAEEDKQPESTSVLEKIRNLFK